VATWFLAVRYRVLNTTRSTELASRAERAESYWTRLVGLLGRAGLSAGEGLHIVPCDSIHMFFMRFPIDAAFLDGEGSVVKVFRRLRPWRATSVYLRVHSVLELPAGTLEATRTEEGDVLVFEDARV
jgi:uncharacterized protein